MAPSALVSTLIPPSGVSHAIFLPLTHSTQHPLPSRPPPSGSPPHPAGRVISNLVVARGRRLRLFEVREEAPRAEGDGTQRTLRLSHVCSHTIHGDVTGLGALQTLSSKEDGLSRLVVSYEVAKMAILEWSDSLHALITVSLHTYERTQRVAQADPHVYTPALRVDPESRAAILMLPGDAIAVLPIVSGHIADFEEEIVGKARREVPYTPSFILDFQELDKRIQHVKDVCFLPGFNSTTIAVLYSTVETWTNRLIQEKTPSTVSLYTLDSTSSTPVTSSTLILHTFLPFSSFSLVPGPVALGGLVILTPNALIHLDAKGNTVECAVNHYHKTEIPAGMEIRGQPDLGLRLEGARLEFLRHSSLHAEALLFLLDGTCHSVRFTKEGGQLKSIVVSRETVARGAALSGIGATSWQNSTEDEIGEGTLLFLGSEVGEGTLVKAWSGPRAPVATGGGVFAELEETGMDVDEELYAPTLSTTNPSLLKPLDQILSSVSSFLPSSTSAGRLQIDVCDRLQDHGSAVDICFGLGDVDQGTNEPQLVTLGGSGSSSTLNFFHKDMPAIKKLNVPPLSAAREFWSLSVSPKDAASDMDTVLVVDEDHERGHTKIMTFTAAHKDPQIVRRIPSATVGAGEFFQRSCFVHVTAPSVSVLEADGRERQSIRAPEGLYFVSASVCDPYVLVRRSDAAVIIFTGETAMGVLGEGDVVQATSEAACVECSIFDDHTGVLAFQPVPRTTATMRASMTEEEEDQALYGDDEELNKVDDVKVQSGKASFEDILDPGRGRQWLWLRFADGRFEIRSTPSLEVVFVSRSLPSLSSVIGNDLLDSSASSPYSADLDALKSPTNTICQTLIAPIGRSSPKLHLLLLTNSEQLVIFEISPSFTTSSGAHDGSDRIDRPPPLKIQLNKFVSRSIRPPGTAQVTEPLPFVRLQSFSNLSGLSGVLLKGHLPHWILSEDSSSAHLYSVDEPEVRAFTPTTLFGSTDEYLLVVERGTDLLALPSNLSVDQPLPARKTPASRTYSHLTYEPASRHLVAAGVFSIPYEIFDEDDARIPHKVTDPKLLPRNERSSLELLDYETCEVIDGYEFADNEIVMALASVNLQTKRTPLGLKDYIAVGTGVSRGEDLAERGATYIFEVAEVVPDASRPRCRFGLKLLAREYSKGPVTALTDMNGFLVSSVGQKIFVRAFDFEDRLVGLAFLEVTIYVTSLRAVKNLLLLGDAVRSVSLFAFQEDPYKLVPLGRDYRQQHVVTTDFLIDGEDAAFVVSDRAGNLRLLEYNPAHPEAEGGQHLVHAAEYYHGSEISSVAMLARRTSERELIAPQSQLLLAGHDGSISTMVVVPLSTFKRLSLLQGQLLRNMQQFSGLNPRAYRTVPNDVAARPLNRGVLDGDLLYNSFELLPLDRQREITQQIGTTVETVLDDLEGLRAVW